MTSPLRPTTESAPVSPKEWLTLPNILCSIRLAGSPVLVLIALAGQPYYFLFGYLALISTDWIDGKLAVWFKQQTSLGAVLDSVADAVLYAALLFGAVWLKGPVLLAEGWWIAVALTTYAASIVMGLLKFHRLPSYHTLLAKFCAFLMVVAAICLFSGWSIVPLRIATAVVALGNLEAIMITYLLPRWRANVWSLYHVLRLPSGSVGESGS